MLLLVDGWGGGWYLQGGGRLVPLSTFKSVFDQLPAEKIQASLADTEVCGEVRV